MKNLVIGVFIGICIGSVSFWAYNKQIQPKQTENTPSNTAKPPTGESLSDMYYTLEQTESSSEFDRLYLNYLIQIRNNETGMSRLAKQKSTKPELADIANESMSANGQLVPQLYSWQKIWGYTHH